MGCGRRLEPVSFWRCAEPEELTLQPTQVQFYSQGEMIMHGDRLPANFILSSAETQSKLLKQHQQENKRLHTPTIRRNFFAALHCWEMATASCNCGGYLAIVILAPKSENALVKSRGQNLNCSAVLMVLIPGFSGFTKSSTGWFLNERLCIKLDLFNIVWHSMELKQLNSRCLK